MEQIIGAIIFLAIVGFMFRKQLKDFFDED